MATPVCIGEPISWLRLERFALDASDAGVGEHVAACAACRQCLDDIRGDVVALPVLHVPERRTWRWFALPAIAALAGAATGASRSSRRARVPRSRTRLRQRLVTAR
jgi:hypothetical protein